MPQIPQWVRKYRVMTGSTLSDGKPTLMYQLAQSLIKQRYRWVGVGAAILVLLIIVMTHKTTPAETPAQAIEAVLAQDRSIYLKENAAASAGKSRRDAIRDVAMEMKTIDLQACPPDFRELYARHAAAWEAFAIEMNEQPQTFTEGLEMGLLNLMSRGETDGGSQRLAAQWDRRLDSIQTTWVEIEAAAARYGAKMPSPPQ